MTCCGFEILAPDRAVVWTDTETYVDGEPSGHAGKMAINPFSVLVGIGTGQMALIAAGAEEVQSCKGFDHAEIWLPPRLKQAAQRYAAHIAGEDWRHFRASHGAPVSITYGIVGYSCRWGRMVGAACGHDGAPPTITSRFSRPRIDMIGINGEQAIIAVVQEQMAKQRQASPKAGAGVVTMAEIDGARIMVRPIFELGTGKPITSSKQFIAARNGHAAGQVVSDRDNRDSGRRAGNSHGSAARR